MDEKNLKGWRAFCFKPWQPVPTVNHIIIIFLFFGSLLVVLGSILTAINSSIIEVSQSYHHCAETGKILIEENDECSINFKLDEKMEPPIFLFYELDNFYQNHRRYVKSKSLLQLAGEDISESDVEKLCDPIQKVSDLKQINRERFILRLETEKKTKMTRDELIELNNTTANPCGLIANSFFTDEFDKLIDSKGNTITIHQDKITWPEDKGNKFKRAYNWKKTQWIDPEDEHFIVWMRTSGLPNFRKLWGRIEKTLEKGNYLMKIKNYYPVSGFKGTKSFVLSTAGPFGGKNYFISTAYLVIGGICFLIAFFFAYKKKVSGGKFGAVPKDD